MGEGAWGLELQVGGQGRWGAPGMPQVGVVTAGARETDRRVSLLGSVLR